MQGDMLIRHHRHQRLQLFVPDDQNLPIPLKYIDVTRQTETSLDSPSEKFIQDYWNVPRDNPAGGDPMQADRQLSEPWTGRTIFNLLRQPPPEGWEWVSGRLTKKQRTNRPPQYGLNSGKCSLQNRRSKQHENGSWKSRGSKQLKPPEVSNTCLRMTTNTLASSTPPEHDSHEENLQQCYAFRIFAIRRGVTLAVTHQECNAKRRGVTPALVRGGSNGYQTSDRIKTE